MEFFIRATCTVEVTDSIFADSLEEAIAIFNERNEGQISDKMDTKQVTNLVVDKDRCF